MGLKDMTIKASERVKDVSCSTWSLRLESSRVHLDLLSGAPPTTSSVASSSSSRSSLSTLSRSSQGSRLTGGASASLATSYVSFRELELRKSQIERELAQVQYELQLRESQRAAAQLQAKPQGK
ncbi:hypothetical protein PHYPSEUDO_004294 [Phytophthora pseudosyringae]|uniref:Uncharacterized protein n=1 Tax=Phytophthora pseudosyringae TaxID=221518 RepID=A0A8T1VS22_9STRA|nr:hypothetical protein PHYPSEUDO_004294 [Phytophthora pseudosyringae]